MTAAVRINDGFSNHTCRARRFCETVIDSLDSEQTALRLLQFLFRFRNGLPDCVIFLLSFFRVPKVVTWKVFIAVHCHDTHFSPSLPVSLPVPHPHASVGH